MEEHTLSSMGGFPEIRGTSFAGSLISKDFRIFGPILGFPDLGKLPYERPLA